MNKNLLLAVLAGIALVVVGALVLFTPNDNTTAQPITPHQVQSKPSQTVAIKVKNSFFASSQSSQRQQPQHKKKIDPTIKATTVDHYNTYLIQLIDENPEDKDIQLQKDPESYRYIDGKINGKQFVLRVPKAVLDKPNIKLKVTNLKTKETKTLDASFLSEAATLPQGGEFRVDINLEHPNDVQTYIKEPDENPPFPTFNK